MTCAAPTTYTKCDTKRTVRNWPAVPGGICIGMYFRNGFRPNTTKIKPSKIRAISTTIFIFGASPNKSMHEGAGTLHAPAPHSTVFLVGYLDGAGFDGRVWSSDQQACPHRSRKTRLFLPIRFHLPDSCGSGHFDELPFAIEYVDRASMDRPMNVSLRNKTIRQALDSILLNGNGYRWKLRNGIIEITNKHGSKHAEGLLNKVIPVFKIPEGETAQKMSTMLWWQVQLRFALALKDFLAT